MGHNTPPLVIPALGGAYAGERATAEENPNHHPPSPFENRRRPAVRSGHPARPAPATVVAFRRAAELARPARLPRQGRPPRARHRCSPPRGLLATGRPPRPLRPRQLPPRPPRAPGPPTAAR
eukprot:XP_020407696.1 salivary acidic proline-rich phosphoprotein 1/2-like [Zea mays]